MTAENEQIYEALCVRLRYLHRVGGVLVVEDEGLLDVLVVPLQRVDLWHVGHDGLLVLLQAGQLVLQGAVHLNGYPADFLQTQKYTDVSPSSTGRHIYTDPSASALIL